MQKHPNAFPTQKVSFCRSPALTASDIPTMSYGASNVNMILGVKY
jgi:hypothetical protein